MIQMQFGKRIHRIAISVDDETLILLNHLAMIDRKELTTFVGHLVEEQVHGVKIRVPVKGFDGEESRRDA